VADTPGLSDREQRLVRLGAMPLLECLRAAGRPLPPLPLFLALPETETARPLDRARLLQLLAIQVDGAFDAARSECAFKGRAGGLLAIGRAAELVRTGRTDWALAGGVDSYRALYVLGTLDRDRRIKSNNNLDGFIPGEGAGFVLIASAAVAKSLDLRPLAVPSAVVSGSEPGHLASEEPYRGDGLATTTTQLLAAARLSSPITEVWSSMNGENYWAKEWGVAFLRNREAFAPNHAIQHPADSFGDTGAACGPILVGLAARGLARAPGPVLIYASSDGGERAVLALTRAQ
jgi:3-oxoacyl-[acyl-carrier-protein] synthase-1